MTNKAHSIGKSIQSGSKQRFDRLPLNVEQLVKSEFSTIK